MGEHWGREGGRVTHHSRPRCATCRWWRLSFLVGRQGVCRINPPVAIRSDRGVWPITFASDFCSKHDQPLFHETRPGALTRDVL